MLPGDAKEHEENFLRILDGHRFVLLGILWLSVQVEFLDYQVLALVSGPELSDAHVQHFYFWFADAL